MNIAPIMIDIATYIMSLILFVFFAVGFCLMLDTKVGWFMLGVIVGITSTLFCIK